MIIETIIVCFTVHSILAPWVHAHARIIEEIARAKEIQNDNMEIS